MKYYVAVEKKEVGGTSIHGTNSKKYCRGNKNKAQKMSYVNI